MPRARPYKDTTQTAIDLNTTSNHIINKRNLKLLKRKLKSNYEKGIEELDRQMRALIEKLAVHVKKIAIEIPFYPAYKNIGELKALTSADMLSKSSGFVSSFGSTQSHDPHNPTTVENSTSTSVTSNSVLNNHNSVVSDSDSRAKKKKNARVFQTPPCNKQLPTMLSSVTPKLKPNTPQILLRRPMQGEVVISMQGSPLFTGNVVTDDTASVNIPLGDGRLLSLQPQRGLRVSQVPELHPETRQQLETLRDNLTKVCSLISRK